MFSTQFPSKESALFPLFRLWGAGQATRRRAVVFRGRRQAALQPQLGDLPHAHI